MLNNMMLRVLEALKADNLPLVRCASDGNYFPVQCKLNLTSKVESCFCVNKEGVEIDSNVEAYPGFPSCTAPSSPQKLGQVLCAGSLSNLCRNGGTCVGNLLNGTLCRCPAAYEGAFCQSRVGSLPAAPPTSLCTFSLAAWQMLRDVTVSGDRSLLSELQLLQNQLFHADTNLPNLMIKAACTAEGEFEPVQCAYNLKTNVAVSCYCIGPKGVLLSTRTNASTPLSCSGSVKLCQREACHLTSCEHGLAVDIHGCELCQCRHPCDGKCGNEAGQRCVVETQASCGRDNWTKACTSGVCRKVKKSGMCPLSVSANLTVLDTLRTPSLGACSLQCLDDADCPGNQKCCGVCGSVCVQPDAEYTCATHRDSAARVLDFTRQVQWAVNSGAVNIDVAPRLVRGQLLALRNQVALWVPECDGQGFYLKTQCLTLLSTSANREGECFCVDSNGVQVAGTEQALRVNLNCNVKPGLCLFLQPNASAQHGCLRDTDCQGDRKCCPDGLGNVCIPPTWPSTQVVSLDDVILEMCGFAAGDCGRNGACVRNYYTHGQVCSCNVGYSGPFCEKQSPEAPRTVCQRRRELQLALVNVSEVLSKFQLQARLTLSPSAPIKLVYPDCLEASGEFAPLQCSRDVDSKQVVGCHCVNRQGAPLVGTEGAVNVTPVCARANPCQTGQPLYRADSGLLYQCGGTTGSCPPGYICRAGQYGELFCCKDAASEVDECLLPPNPGNDCQYLPGKTEVTRTLHYFDPAAQTCRPVTYKGCSDVMSNFPSLEACEARCIRKEHLGQCPSLVAVPDRTRCSNSCQADGDCRQEQKCCPSSCGKRCVLALNTDQRLCELGQPLRNLETGLPGSCSTSGACAEGYVCRSALCCLRRDDNICQLPAVAGSCLGRQQVRYSFNPSTQSCHSFLYSGCGGNDNNFLTRDECCNTCGRAGRCKDGVCPVASPVLSMSCDQSCLGDGDCPTNQICCNTSCGGKACVIAKASSDTGLSCFVELADYYQRMNLSTACYLKPKPRCDISGQWEKQQCSDKLGLCWCVTSKGYVIPGTRVRGVAQCQWVTPSQETDADNKGMRGEELTETCQVCPPGQQTHCCDEDLCLGVCAADPTAVCRLNPCGGCQPVFYSKDNQVVNCTVGLTSCQKSRHQALAARHQYSLIALAAEVRFSGKMFPLHVADISGTQITGMILESVPYLCQLKPDSGTCKAYTPQWFYNVTSQRCEVFLYGLCGGNDNRFHTPDDCYRQCNAAVSPCKNLQCASGQACQLTFKTNCFSGTCGLAAECAAATGGHELAGVYVPECTAAGSYAWRQCHEGRCWCVSEDGLYRNGLTSDPTSLQCGSAGPLKMGTPIMCPTGGASVRVMECAQKCKDAVCPDHPSARCVVDTCTCDLRFIDAAGLPVTCGSNFCSASVFIRAANNCPNLLLCEGLGPKKCPYKDPCHGAVCKNNPCAICFSDACTGENSYLDMLTKQHFSQQECNKIRHTSCEMRRCEVLTQRSRASANSSVPLDSLVPPVCDQDGSYLPQQRRADNSTYCVNDFGEPAGNTSSGCARDPLVQVTASVVYEGVFERIVPGREALISLAFANVLEQIGIVKTMITNTRVKRGSIIVDVDLVRRPEGVDLAVVKPLIITRAASGDLTLTVDGITLKVAAGPGAVVISPYTASKRTAGAAAATAGLSAGGVAGIVIAVLLLAAGAGGVAFYFLYYRRRCPRPESGAGSTGDTGDTRPFGRLSDLYSTIIRPWKKTKDDSPKLDVVDQNVLNETYDNHYVKACE